MEFSIKRETLLKSLNLAQGIIEKKNTLPILSNVLLKAEGNKLIVVATDLDLFFYDEIDGVKITKEGRTTTSANILHDVLKKLSSDSEIYFNLISENKLNLKTDNSNFNLLCLPTDNFPDFSDNFENNEIVLKRSKFSEIKLLAQSRKSSFGVDLTGRKRVGSSAGFLPDGQRKTPGKISA